MLTGACAKLCNRLRWLHERRAAHRSVVRRCRWAALVVRLRLDRLRLRLHRWFRRSAGVGALAPAADVAQWWRERFGVEVPVDDGAYRRTRGSSAERSPAPWWRPRTISRSRQVTPQRSTVTRRCRTCRPSSAHRSHPRPTGCSPRSGTTVASLGRPDRIRTSAAGDCGVMYLDTSRSRIAHMVLDRGSGDRHKVHELRAPAHGYNKGEMR